MPGQPQPLTIPQEMLAQKAIFKLLEFCKNCLKKYSSCPTWAWLMIATYAYHRLCGGLTPLKST